MTYFVLFGVYSLYLNQTQSKGDVFSCAPITKQVARNVQTVSTLLGYDTKIEQHDKELSIKYFLNDQYTARIVEGCNSISIIILFLTFIIAFSGSLKATFFYGVFGIALIYVVNILRIVAMTVLYQKYPQYEKILHDLLFPAVIYGLVFVLWVTWVKFYSNIGKK